MRLLFIIVFTAVVFLTGFGIGWFVHVPPHMVITGVRPNGSPVFERR